MGKPWGSTLSQGNIRYGLKFLSLKIQREIGVKNKANKKSTKFA